MAASCLLFSSAEAVENHDDFDKAVCVLLDIDLDDELGIELRHRLMANSISVPVIYMTGNDSPAVREPRNNQDVSPISQSPLGEVLREPLETASAGLT